MQRKYLDVKTNAAVSFISIQPTPLPVLFFLFCKFVVFAWRRQIIKSTKADRRALKNTLFREGVELY